MAPSGPAARANAPDWSEADVPARVDNANSFISQRISQTAGRLWIAHSVLGFESGQVDQRFLFGRLFPNADQFDQHIAAFASRDGVQDNLVFANTRFPPR